MDALPPELLSEIFGALNIRAADQPEARVFSSVCRAFRRVVVNAPVMWSLFIISIDGSRPTENASKWVDLKLRRSKRSHIIVSIRLKMGATRDTFAEHVSPMLRHCERWGELELKNIPDVFMDLLQSAKGRLPNLRLLSLRTPSSWENKVPSFLEGLSSLDDLSVIPLPERISVLPLQKLRFCGLSMENTDKELADNVQPIAPILSAMLNPNAQLQELLLFLYDEALDDWNCGPLDAPQLLYLTFKDTSIAGSAEPAADNCTNLLDLLTASSLERLTVCSRLVRPSTFLRFAQRSDFKLQYLNLEDTRLNEDIVRMLSMQPTLGHLKVAVHGVLDLQPFPQFRTPFFLPNLTNLELNVLTPAWTVPDENWKDPVPIAGEVELLDAIATARCDLQPGESHMPSSSGHRRLKNFQIHCLEDEDFLKGRALIFARSMSAEECGLDPGLLRYLKGCSVGFSTICRVVEGYAQHPRTQEIIGAALPDLFSSNHLARSNQHSVMNDVQYLYVSDFPSLLCEPVLIYKMPLSVQHSGFHTMLACVVRCMSPCARPQSLKDSMSFDTFPGIERQATRLLKSLVPLLEEDVPRLRWRYNAKSCSLIYTPNDHGMHASSLLFS